MKLTKPGCFTEFQWEVYKTELQEVKNKKVLDICVDCTIQYQSKMRKENKCNYPMKRIDRVTEYVG